MADHDIPADLIDLKRAFLAADRRCAELAERLPPNFDAVGSFVLAEVPVELARGLEAARAERLRIVLAKAAHPFWDGVDNRALADLEVTRAAEEAMLR